ncbi:hypothetical protein GE21DRAFT_1010548 [Neurospora crassa]|nr:hypothetical protein GE21DRAFT_1010548 [Neurospora crassa]
MVRRRSRLPKLPRARPVQIMSGVCVWGIYGTTVTDCGRWLARPCRENYKQNRARYGGRRRLAEPRVGVDDGDVHLKCGRVSWGNGDGGSNTPEGGVLQWDRWRAVCDKTDSLARELRFLPKLGRTAPGGYTSLNPRLQLRGSRGSHSSGSL